MKPLLLIIFLSVSALGQFPKSNTGGGASGVTSITGTTDQVVASAATGAVTLSLPQSIASTSTPTFDKLTLSAASTGVALTVASGTALLRTGSVGTNLYIDGGHIYFRDGNGGNGGDVNTYGLNLRNTSNVSKIMYIGDSNFDAASDTLFRFSSTTVTTGTKDAGIARNAAGVLEINNGVAATFVAFYN